MSDNGLQRVDDRAKIRGASIWVSFLQGVGSILDMFTPPSWPDGELSDGEKLQGDWDQIVGDFWRVVQEMPMPDSGVDSDEERSAVAAVSEQVGRRQHDAAKPI